MTQSKQSASHQTFWVAYQLGAYQGRFDDEYDPDSGVITPGVTSPYPGLQVSGESEAGVVLFAESLRDGAENSQRTITVPNLRSATSVHELGHTFGMLSHTGFGAIMEPATVGAATTQQQLDNLEWNGAALRRIMLTKQPGYAPHDPN